MKNEALHNCNINPCSKEIPVRQISEADERRRIAREILEALTDWFEITETREAYIRESADQLFFAAEEDGRAAGFLCLKETGRSTVELAVMGVRKEYHRRGIGRALFQAAKEQAVLNGYEFMQVKTVKMGCYEDYDRTNEFYLSVGFKELEVFPTLWDEANPCQIYVMSLKEKEEQGEQAAHAEQAEHTVHAEQAEHAEQAVHAEQAEHAEQAVHAERAEHSDQAEHSEQAEHSDQVEHAERADHTFPRMMLDVINQRRSYRGTYKPDKVPREDLVAIMEAGLAAPSGCNKQTTSLIAVDDPQLLAKLHAEIDPPIAETAPAMICVLTKRVIAYRDRCFATQDYSAAIENMLLMITSLGYQSCWYEGHITDLDRIGDRMAKILGVPDRYELVCVLPVGIAREEPVIPYKRVFEKRAAFNGFTEEMAWRKE